MKLFPCTAFGEGKPVHHFTPTPFSSAVMASVESNALLLQQAQGNLWEGSRKKALTR